MSPVPGATCTARSGTTRAADHVADWPGIRSSGCAGSLSARRAGESGAETLRESKSLRAACCGERSPSNGMPHACRSRRRSGDWRSLPDGYSEPDTAVRVWVRQRVVWSRPPSPGETACAETERTLFRSTVGGTLHERVASSDERLALDRRRTCLGIRG